MGDLLALLSALCFATGSVMIARGAGAKGEDNGAFLSIVLTLSLATLVWIASVLHRGWTAPNVEGVAWFAVAGALSIFIGRVFLYSSVQRLGAVRASSVKRLAPLFSVLLGVLVLKEALSWPVVCGMAMIFGGFALLTWESSAAAPGDGAPVAGAAASVDATPAHLPWARTGVLYGAISALAYSAGNIARKFGMIEVPDAALGVMLSSLTGALLFLATALCVETYRTAVRSTFFRFNPWLWAAGILGSVGQLLFFAAIDFTSVSRAVLIGSSEVFITMALTALFFPNREKLTAAAIAAAVLAGLGTLVMMTVRTS